MLSATPAAAAPHSCRDAHKGHHHHHHAQNEVATPQHFLQHNPCDAADFSEVCACCQGAIDVDELVGLKAAAPHKSVTSSHNHSDWRPRIPVGKTGWALAGVTTWATVPGLWFGVQNYRAANHNAAALREALEGLQKSGGTQAPLGTQTQRNHEARNRAAYALTLQQSCSMQRFIGVFAGALPLLGSICMLGSVAVPLLGAVGSGFLLIYCLSHVARYMTYEWPRVQVLRQELKQATAVPHASDAQDKGVLVGLEASAKLLRERARLYPTVAAAFTLYAAGAALLSASVLVAPAVLVPAGATALAAGLSAVLYLNNGPIKAAYGKNQDRAIDRRSLGSQKDILQRIAQLQREADTLRLLRDKVGATPKRPEYRGAIAAATVTRCITWGLSYGATFGLVSMGRDQALTRLRKLQLEAIDAPHRLMQQARLAQPVSQLYQLLHNRPDEVDHERGALLDHFHARVALEGLNLANA